VTAAEYFWIEYENDDMGPFVERELAEMALGSDEGQIFTSGDGGCTPIVALVSPAWQSTAVEWRGVGLGEQRDLTRRSLARAIAGPNSVTVNCVHGQHDECHGYVAPLVYSATRPCGCVCHDAGGRDFHAGLERARRSYYSEREPAEIGGAFDGFTVTSDADPGL